MKSNKGITLVALVITIIVLLILAGVSISLVVGDNGVLTQASNSSDATKLSQFKEAVGLAVNECQTAYFSAYAGNASTSALKYINITSMDSALSKQGYALCTKSGTEYTIVEDGETALSDTYYVFARPSGATQGSTKCSGDCLGVKFTNYPTTTSTTTFGLSTTFGKNLKGEFAE